MSAFRAHAREVHRQFSVGVALISNYPNDGRLSVVAMTSELLVIREEQTFFAKSPRIVNSGALSGPARREAISCPNDFPGNALIDRVTGIIYDNEVRCFPDAFEPPGVEER